jgi:uncharacterized membrane protein
MILAILILAFVSTLIGAAGALCLKLSAKNISFNPAKLIRNWPLIAGALLYAIASIIFIFALKLGELSVVYPMTALSYVWVALLAGKILKERLHIWKCLGIGMIVLGVVLISLQ